MPLVPWVVFNAILVIVPVKSRSIVAPDEMLVVCPKACTIPDELEGTAPTNLSVEIKRVDRICADVVVVVTRPALDRVDLEESRPPDARA